MAKYYTPSGKFDPKAFLYFVLITLIALPILGLAYSYAIWYIPFIYINFLIAGALGFAVAWLISKFVIRTGKLRNRSLAIGLSILAGLIVLYCSWVVWIDLALNIGESYGSDRIGITTANIKMDQVLALAANPSAVFELMGIISEVGTWGIRTATVSGTFLIIIWIIEAILIVGATAVFTNGATEPFCELGNEWFDAKNLPVFNPIEDRKQLVQDLEQSNPDAFKKLSYAPSLEQHHAVFTLYSSNHNENYLTVTNMIAKRNKDGELEFDSDVVVNHIHLNGELKEKLVNFKEEVKETPSTEKQITEDAPSE